MHRHFFKGKNKNKFLAIIFVIEYENSSFKALGKVNIVKLKDLQKLLQVLHLRLDTKGEEYHNLVVQNIVLTYKIVKNYREDTIIHQPKESLSLFNRFTSFHGLKLPVTTNLLLWGDTISRGDNSIVIQSSKHNNIQFHIKTSDISNKVVVMSDDNFVFEFTDYLDSGYNSFKRIINNLEYIYIQGELVLKYHRKRTTFIKKIAKAESIDNRIITLDLETRTVDNVVSPYCACSFDGSTSRSYYLPDFYSVEEMLTNSLMDLIDVKYDGYAIYVHNFSGFDGIFLLKILAQIQKINSNIEINVIKRDSFIIEVCIKLDDKFKIFIRDSLLILHSSLRELANYFSVESKSIFPYKLVNVPGFDLEYVGSVTDKMFFDKITQKNYIAYKENYNGFNWSLRDETIKYCIQDCRSLYQVLSKFNSKVFDMFSVNINKTPTLPSLTFTSYRSNFLVNDIPIVVGEVYDFIKKSYTGGSVDMYIPYSDEIVYWYDVISLYPYIMANFDMPVGIPKHFTVNNLDNNFNFLEYYQRVYDKRPYGFFLVDVTAPDFLIHPILQTKVHTKAGLRTVSGLGNWRMVIFSEEMYNALDNFGYRFKVLEGYLFDQANIFKDYIQKLYILKQNSNRGDSMYLISKLFMNSLYGVWTMKWKDIILFLRNSLIILSK